MIKIPTMLYYLSRIKRGKMESLVNFALQEKYAKVKKLRSRLENIGKLIDWNKFIVKLGLIPRSSAASSDLVPQD